MSHQKNSTWNRSIIVRLKQSLGYGKLFYWNVMESKNVKIKNNINGKKPCKWWSSCFIKTEKLRITFLTNKAVF